MSNEVTENLGTPMQKIAAVEQSEEVQTAVKLMLALFFDIECESHIKLGYKLENGEEFDFILCKKDFFKQELTTPKP